MQLDLSPYEARIILKWYDTTSEGIFGSLGGIATLRSATLADRVAELLAQSRGAAVADAPAVRRAEEDAGRILREVVASVEPELRLQGYEFVYAGIVHALPRDDPRYFSVVDLQIERVGAEAPTYEFLADGIPVWRDGRPCIGEEGADLRRRLNEVVEGWVRRI